MPAVALLVSAGLYAVVVLWYLRGLRRLPGAVARHETPTVAVVVAARDEAANVEACLRALGRQAYPRDRFEIVLVDDGSVDGTGDRARATAGALAAEGIRVRVLDGPATYGEGGAKKAALGLGIASSDSELILTTDADCVVPPTWVQAMVGTFAADTGAVIGFSQIGAPGQRAGALAAWEGLDFLVLMAAAAGSCAQGHPMSASGQSLAFRRGAFDAVGGYATVRHRVSGDDVLLLQLIRRTGRWRIDFCADSGGRVVHPPSPGLLSFLNRRARWASNAPLQLRLDPLFFGCLAVDLVAATAFVAGPVLWAVGVTGAAAVLASWGLKIAVEALIVVTGARRFGRGDLLRAFLPWTFLHPVYTVAVGVFGPLGFFRWKGRHVAFGRQAPSASTVASR